MTAVIFVLAAAGGTLIRAVTAGFDTNFNRRLIATAAVNVAGAFLLGVVQGADANTITALGVGGLGAMTTFSTFVSQIECIAREGEKRDAWLYAIGLLTLGLAAAALGLAL